MFSKHFKMLTPHKLEKLKGKKVSSGNPLKFREAEQPSHAIETGQSVTLENEMSLKVKRRSSSSSVLSIS